MKLQFYPEARQELFETAQFYENKTKGLGDEFLDEVERILQLIETSPDIGSLFGDSSRKKLLKRFPYGIVYWITDDKHIKIYALMHVKRKPGYWKNPSSLEVITS